MKFFFAFVSVLPFYDETAAPFACGKQLSCNRKFPYEIGLDRMAIEYKTDENCTAIEMEIIFKLN